ncbi:efflux RND transporter periplasmic adaptor subunit [Pseudooceanicola sp. LIPI14-2-Ac024]|uniref:efflux RND transporter periplasmic adaptor subunit n=1 Tax=Pseudooceanicola sp. LIPI14-2-Ac024 TaxID=3344875 RepID=UPI0035CEE5EA
MNDDHQKPDWAMSDRERANREAAARGEPVARRRWLWPVVILVAVIVVLALLIGGGDDDADAPPATNEVVMQILPSELAEVSSGTLRDVVRVTGSLAPARTLAIPAEVSGRVATVEVQAGDAVEEGDVLVTIDVQTLTNQLEQQRANAEATRAQLELAEEEFARTESLVNRGVSSPSALDQQQAQVRQLEANLQAQLRQVATAEDSLGKATVTAPFAGIISERSVDPGAYVNTGTALMTLVDISELDLNGVVPVIYAPQIGVGQAGEVRVDGLGDRVFQGTVERIAPVATSGTRMLPIFAAVANPDGALKGGMFASGVLVLDEKQDAIGIPVEALREDSEGQYVLKQEGDIVVRQPVETGKTWEGGQTVEIASGLSDGDIIISTEMARLQPGMKITVVEE